MSDYDDAGTYLELLKDSGVMFADKEIRRRVAGWIQAGRVGANRPTKNSITCKKQEFELAQSAWAIGMIRRTGQDPFFAYGKKPVELAQELARATPGLFVEEDNSDPLRVE